MFNAAEKTDLNQISLTGTRALVLVGLLIVKPRTLSEIRQAFIDFKIMEESHSDDIIRIDINTIKAMGCEISRASAKTNYKYILTKHPFSLQIVEDEINVLKKVYNRVKSVCDLETLIAYDELFKKIATYVVDEDVKEKLLGISVLKYYDIDKIKNLIWSCENKQIITLNYKKTTSAIAIRKEILSQEMVFKNDKIYLYGYDLYKKDSVILTIKGILEILASRSNDDDIRTKTTKIKFLLKDLRIRELCADEKIIGSTAEGYIVEGAYHNEFLAMQRVLSMGARCVVIEPLDFRSRVIELIKEMRKVYEY